MSILDGKIALVTGGAQGLGESCARGLAARGARVFIADRNAPAGEALAADIGNGSVFVPLDVADEASWRNALEAVGQHSDKVDVLVNNAGVMEFEPFGEMSLNTFDRVMAINVRGTFLGCQLILPLMRKAGGGSIINISSIAGMIANMEGCGAYSTSKGAIRMMTKAAAVDYVRFGIRVNSVHPGAMWTPRSESTLSDTALHDLAIGRVLMRRAADPAEVANAVAFLASDEASYMTGSEMVVDGGVLPC